MGRARKLVALQLPPGPAFLRAWDAVWQADDALLPLNPRLPGPGRERLLAALRPHELWDESGRHSLPDGAPLDPRTDLVVITSGSTGRPKGVELSRPALESSARATLTRLGAGAADAWLCCLPLDHVAGLQVVLRARLSGAPLRLHERFAVQTVAAERAAFVSLVPTMLVRLLDAGADLRGYRTVLLGGAAAPDVLLQRAAAAGIHVVTTYGMTETAGGCVYDGLPLDGVEVDLTPAGVVRLRGSMLFHGYRLDPTTTAAALADGWFTTADAGERDGDRLRVLGRTDDVVISGGENVSLSEVAQLLERHPSVVEAAAFAMADPEWGHAVAAAVVPRDGVPAPTLPELRAHVGGLASAHKAPRHLLIVASIPRTDLGKIDREALRDAARANLGVDEHP